MKKIKIATDCHDNQYGHSKYQQDLFAIFDFYNSLYVVYKKLDYTLKRLCQHKLFFNYTKLKPQNRANGKGEES